MVRFKYDGEVNVIRRDDEGYSEPATSGTGAVDRDRHAGEWLVAIAKWYRDDPSVDDRAGVRALAFSAADFPFGAWSLDAYDAGDLTVKAIADVDTSDDPDAVTDEAFPDREPHRLGFVDARNVLVRLDNIELFGRP